MAVLESAADERPLQKFLGSRPGMLAQQISACCRWVIALPRLDAEYVPDFAVARLDNSGLRWTLVELESPRARLFTQQGRKSRQFDAVPGRSTTGGSGLPLTAITRGARKPQAAWACRRSAIQHADWSSSAAGTRCPTMTAGALAPSFSTNASRSTPMTGSSRRGSVSGIPLTWHGTAWLSARTAVCLAASSDEGIQARSGSTAVIS